MTIKRLLIAMPILLLGWIATLAVVMRLGGEAPAAFVPFPSATLMATLPQDIAITGQSPVSLTLRSEADNLPARLYQSGAWLVLPAGLEACIPNFLRETPATR
ncbi:hypothetical protein [Jannaschia sp. CCS1]|uniref:hypothetical protein n=1 Tax=Jannaschia sp. (strain CCS1) TaxID=290400 RepID=UPI000053D949|nr:hypothetical protein [Jannaschia sp. CCS1]ABD54505.1 hypothetical protein Jann_1588 [Jannaschia sp. CCS1]